VGRGLLSAVALVLLAVSLASCYSPNREEQAERLERLIRTELPRSLEQHLADDGHGKYRLGSVQCDHDGDDRFTCVLVASRSYDENESVYEGVVLQASGSCIEMSCSWRMLDQAPQIG